jgi:hypothetical protein
MFAGKMLMLDDFSWWLLSVDVSNGTGWCCGILGMAWVTEHGSACRATLGKKDVTHFIDTAPVRRCHAYAVSVLQPLLCMHGQHSLGRICTGLCEKECYFFGDCSSS